MKQTEHYGLNQWELADRIRMSDFNADNAKIAAALAGLDGRAAALETQADGLASQEALDSAKADLEAADQKLQSDKLQTCAYYGATDERLKFQLENGRYVLNTDPLELNKFAVYRLQIFITDSKSDTYYLNPIIQENVKLGNCIYTGGTSDKAMIVLTPWQTANCLFFPMRQKNAVLGALFYGATVGVGAYAGSYYLLKGFALTPASGSLDPAIKITVDLDGIK